MVSQFSMFIPLILSLLDVESAKSTDKEETQAESYSTVCEPIDSLNESITQLKQTI